MLLKDRTGGKNDENEKSYCLGYGYWLDGILDDGGNLHGTHCGDDGVLSEIYGLFATDKNS